MKIYLISDSLNPSLGGPPVSINNLYNQLKNQNIDVTRITLDGSYADGSIYEIPKLVNNISSEKNIIHINGVWSRSARFLENIKLNDRKLVLSPRGCFDEPSFKKKFLKKYVAWKIIFSKIFNKYNSVVTTSDYETIGVKKRLNLPVVEIPNIVNTIDFDFTKECYACYVGRIDKQKRLIQLIDFYHKYLSHLDGLIFAGSLKEDGEFILNYAKTKLGEKFHYKGQISNSEIPGFFKSIGLNLNFCPSENFGNSICEGLLMGCYTIAPKLSPWDFTKNKFSGLNLDPQLNNSDQLGCVLKGYNRDFLISNKYKISQKYRKLYNPSKVIQDYTKFYENI